MYPLFNSVVPHHLLWSLKNPVSSTTFLDAGNAFTFNGAPSWRSRFSKLCETSCFHNGFTTNM